MRVKKWSLAVFRTLVGVIQYARTQHPTEGLHNFVLRRKGSHQEHIDHKNRNGLDCRKSNLRSCSPA